MNEKDQEILYPTKQTGKEMTADFKENLAVMKEILAPDISYDIVYRTGCLSVFCGRILQG